MGIILLSTQPVMAEEPVQGSDSIVLVLKLVSATHVKPTTGLVVSDTGLIVISAGFAIESDEIVVLDGGTDISRYGRPARVVKHSSSGELALLAVEGLNRPAVELSQTDTNDELPVARVLHLTAFPPARGIAAGEQPLWVPVTVTEHDSSGKTSASPATPLPNVTGAIIDQCGLLFGLNLARGEQSLDASKNPTTVFFADLVRVLDSVNVSLSTASCNTPAQDQVPDVPESQEAASATGSKATEEPAPVSEERPAELTPDEKAESIPDLDTSAKDYEEPVYSVATGDESAPFLSPWQQLLALIVVAAMVTVAMKFFSRSTRPSRQSDSLTDAVRPLVDSDEPGTAVLQSAEDSPLLDSAASCAEADELPNLDKLPAGYDGYVLLEGLADKVHFRRFCMVNSEQFDIVIGRIGADLKLESPAISRSHARLEGRDGFLTFADLNSSNGSFIRGIPCLPGEIMFIDPADEIQLGNLHLQIKTVTAKTAAT